MISAAAKTDWFSSSSSQTINQTNKQTILFYLTDNRLDYSLSYMIIDTEIL